jgi:hypothetical protein
MTTIALNGPGILNFRLTCNAVKGNLQLQLYVLLNCMLLDEPKYFKINKLEKNVLRFLEKYKDSTFSISNTMLNAFND